jgi:hypothetical protein
MMIRVQQVMTVAEFLETVKERFGGVKGLRAHVKTHPRDVTARLDLEDFEFYLNHPEMQHEKMERAVSLIPLTAKALSMFTRQRLALLEILADKRFESVRKLAEHLDRDIHNVYEDLKLFHGLGIIEFERGPRNSRIPRLVADSISVFPRNATVEAIKA